MPLKSFALDAFGVASICLVVILLLLGLLCIAYSSYFRYRIRSQGYHQLGYFSGPWIIKIVFVLLVILWCSGEITRLSFLRRKGSLFDSIDLRWQEIICKGYIISNLGLAEPCLFLTLVFLLRSPLQKLENGIFSQRNRKIAGFVLLFGLPMLAFQLFVLLAAPRFQKEELLRRLPPYFTRAALPTKQTNSRVAFCCYPLMNTAILGVFAAFLTLYMSWLGRKILKLAINRALQKRICTLIWTVSSLLPLRVLFLGLSVLAKPESILFETLVFFAFLSLVFCAAMCVWILVYCPVADSLALGDVHDIENRRSRSYGQNDTVSLIANPDHNDINAPSSSAGDIDNSSDHGSISFRINDKGGFSGGGSLVEMSTVSSQLSAPGSSSTPKWPISASRLPA